MTYQIIKPELVQSSMMNNTEMIKQFLGLYLHQLPVDFGNLTVAVLGKNKADIARYAHHIKPTMEYIGASEMRINFQELETLAKSNASMEELERIFNTIDVRFGTLMSELKSYLENLT
ncbi:Hpt domain-containing protein [Sphingobacterium olei]|uniref:Hpt domain-containing protein n=1 Tax=Sphingobacterium olei TaxID=2571155 RepID=A0A4U0NKD7_9SPHI|nr:Hpt domain-containing protein [Sphingobacterium olei]TJZ54819.1 Hpt domain-containing protein [Sphingobacterium olei]